jgi:hypothetical protein
MFMPSPPLPRLHEPGQVGRRGYLGIVAVSASPATRPVRLGLRCHVPGCDLLKAFPPAKLTAAESRHFALEPADATASTVRVVAPVLGDEPHGVPVECRNWSTKPFGVIVISRPGLRPISPE